MAQSAQPVRSRPDNPPGALRLTCPTAGYSPELNPDEWVWRHLKNHELASYAPHDLKELRRELRLAVVRMRRRPALIRAFVSAADLPD